MKFSSLRLIPVIVLVVKFSPFLTPAKAASNLNWNCFFNFTHNITFPDARAKTDRTRSDAIRQYLADNFGVPDFKASWYDNIIHVEVMGDTATVTTNLSRGDERIRNLCGVVSGFVYSHFNAQLGIRKVKILGGSGEVLVFPQNVLDDCPP